MKCYDGVFSYQAVSLMGTGLSPQEAAQRAIDTILRKYPTFKGAVVAANKMGAYGEYYKSNTNVTDGRATQIFFALSRSSDVTPSNH